MPLDVTDQQEQIPRRPEIPTLLTQPKSHISQLIWEGHERNPPLKIDEMMTTLNDWHLHNDDQINFVKRHGLYLLTLFKMGHLDDYALFVTIERTLERYTRAYLLYLIGVSIFADATQGLYIEKIFTCAIYAYLFQSWVYEHIKLSRLEPKQIKAGLPRALRWGAPRRWLNTHHYILIQRQELDNLKAQETPFEDEPDIREEDKQDQAYARESILVAPLEWQSREKRGKRPDSWAAELQSKRGD
ncbi:hypothetical protein AMTR_s00028p00157780 [Amborella trichopoda]|uniref:Aminotransferase-like plant mobile domain-containing protein n=1 Tax=Amborella trichopoda TaxID=13333 RepID=W1PRD7_AMBTC|nr:hypothetical protein AMTR_s00028p00157780 [Amborella trichopoda]